MTKRLREKVKPDHHDGHGAHVARIYDDVLWRRLERRAEKEKVFIGVVVTAACEAFLANDTPLTPPIGTPPKDRKRMAKAKMKRYEAGDTFSIGTADPTVKSVTITPDIDF